ncbi:MAG: hypothetical protein P9L94_18620 [Candidatus Hinthialibacter antarcticus]|nr:hypothetical protein [Candidatus Hinthialibacter antarcticus]
MEVTLFTKGQFTVGDHTAKVTELEWDLPGESVEMMSGPVMLVKAYSDRFESATIRSGSDSLPYFEAVKGDLYRLKRNDEGVGYNFEFHYKLDAETNRIVFNPLTVKTRTVVDRKHIRGAGSLSVGEPIIEELNFPLRVNLRLGWFYGVLLPVKGEGNILMRFKFSQTDL